MRTTSLAAESAKVRGHRAEVNVCQSYFYREGLFCSSESSSVFKMELQLEGDEWKIVHSDSYFAYEWEHPPIQGDLGWFWCDVSSSLIGPAGNLATREPQTNLSANVRDSDVAQVRVTTPSRENLVLSQSGDTMTDCWFSEFVPGLPEAGVLYICMSLPSPSPENAQRGLTHVCGWEGLSSLSRTVRVHRHSTSVYAFRM